MAISRIENKGWRVRVQIAHPTLRTKKISLPVEYFPTKREAEKREKELKVNAYKMHSDYGESSELTVGAFMKMYIQRKKVGKIQSSTLKVWDRTQSLLDEYFPTVKIRDWTYLAAQDFINDVGSTRSKETIQHIYFHINKMMEYAAQTGIDAVKSNFMAAVDVSNFDRNRTRSKDLLSDDEYNQYRWIFREHDFTVENVNKHVGDLVGIVVSFTGIRNLEALGLRWSDFQVSDRGTGYFVVKGQWQERMTRNGVTEEPHFKLQLKDRSAGETRKTLDTLPQEMVAVLENYRVAQSRWLKLHGLNNPKNLIFLNIQSVAAAHSGYPVTTSTINNRFKLNLHKLGIPTENRTFRVLRRTYENYMRRKGVDLLSLSQVMGHSPIVAAKAYLKMNDDQYDEVSKKLDIDDVWK